MKPFLRSQLERYAQRLGELDFLLSREDIMSDMAQYRRISVEHAEVTQVAGRNAFVQIRAGTGGDAAALFAGDLTRMYTRYAANVGWKVEVVSENAAELGGYKEIVLRIEGLPGTGPSGSGVYGALKFESGGHRVQRVPATET